MNEYFKEMYSKIQDNWNVDSSLKYFGIGKSNEGSEESKAILRYYIEPDDKRFRQIFLNFDMNRNIESIVWFLDRNESELLSLAQLKELFGLFETHNIVYDETTELFFLPTQNKFIKYVQTTIPEWVEKRRDGTLYFIKGNQEYELDDNYKVSTIVFKIMNAA
ncbi:hypothetical protein [Flavobacterium stagni]|uniref:Uncharacterized protein n=1 Tax=Flavobacterium stagni TaxID=2506421 RepID=A0A4Q1K1Q7_9FLAO|nr:hypothetical protein [Flavobacterium stagni]RXR18890.1 hypothetical protein EQG61_13610 [Flavobacterium stagni]